MVFFFIPFTSNLFVSLFWKLASWKQSTLWSCFLKPHNNGSCQFEKTVDFGCVHWMYSFMFQSKLLSYLFSLCLIWVFLLFLLSLLSFWHIQYLPFHFFASLKAFIVYCHFAGFRSVGFPCPPLTIVLLVVMPFHIYQVNLVAIYRLNISNVKISSINGFKIHRPWRWFDITRGKLYVASWRLIERETHVHHRHCIERLSNYLHKVQMNVLVSCLYLRLIYNKSLLVFKNNPKSSSSGPKGSDRMFSLSSDFPQCSSLSCFLVSHFTLV